MAVRRRLTEQRLMLALLVAGAAVQSVLVLVLVRTSWFGADDVAYLTTRGPVPSADLGLWRPYGGHWQTIPLLVYRGLFEVVGLRSYLPYVGLALALHLAIVFVTYALLRQVGVRPRTAAVVAWFVLFFGAGAEAFMWDAPFVLTSGLLVGLVSMLVLIHSAYSGRSRLAAAALLLAAVMCSGTGLVSAVTVGVFVLLRRGLVAALAVVAPAFTAFVIWYLALGREGGRVNLTADTLPDIPRFVWSGLTGPPGAVLGVPGTGVVLLLVLVAVVLWARTDSAPLRQLAVAGIAGACAQLVLAAFANVSSAEDAARVGRYEYVVLVLLAPAVAIVWEAGGRALRMGLADPRLRRVVGVAVALVVLGVATTQGVHRMHQQAAFGEAQAKLYRTWVYGSVQAADAGERQLVVDASTGFNGGRFELFATPTLRNALPARAPDPRTRLDAESEYFVEVSASDPGLFSPTRVQVEGLNVSDQSSAGAGCRAYLPSGSTQPLVEVSSRDGTEIGITSSSTLVSTQVVRDGVSSRPRTWAVAPGPLYVATTARDATLRISLNGTGGYSLCHL
jgi:hypothetical protein